MHFTCGSRLEKGETALRALTGTRGEFSQAGGACHLFCRKIQHHIDRFFLTFVKQPAPITFNEFCRFLELIAGDRQQEFSPSTVNLAIVGSQYLYVQPGSG